METQLLSPLQIVGVDEVFILVYSNQDENSTSLKLKDIIFQKAQSKITTSLSMERIFYDKPIDSDIKRYEEIGQLTTGPGDDYTTGFLLDCY